ncbi:MAG: septum formation protein Maf [Deltaproteobacteria bacterium]|nr:septum formation protein Maf [Deltaproteobacteria bacterium]
MFKTITPLVLASQSPRRRQLLSQMGIEFSLTGADIEEFQLPDEKPVDFVDRMARCKALEVVSSYPESWILAADTIVVLDQETLGKPIDEAEACDMLARLSGRWHQVLTAFTLHHQAMAKTITRIDFSRVKIVPLDAVTIAAYVNSGEPLDKAGSYAVQGIGGAFVEAIDGSPTNVIGLPLPLVIRELLNNHIIALR